MINIQTHPPQSTVTTLTIDLVELPELSLGRRVALALSLVLITSVEPRKARKPARDPELRRLAGLHIDERARREREQLAERVLLGAHAWR
jgi:hypothetical protein